MAMDKPEHLSEAAWSKYSATLVEQRQTLLTHRVSIDPLIRAQGLYAIHSR